MTRVFPGIAVALLVLLASCSRTDNASTDFNDGQARIQFILTDNPAHYDHVFVNIKEVLVNVGQPEPDNGRNGNWVTYPLRPNFDRRVDLLDLRNGDFVYMGEPFALPAGDISQIRLVLEESGNAVVVDGVETPLKTPSAQQSGLKIKFHHTLEAGHIYKIWLDFDAARSVVARGNGQYNLKPVIRAVAESADFGAISGVVLPMESGATVYLRRNGEVIATAIPEESGSRLGVGFFKFPNLEPGTYELVFTPAAASGYKENLVSNVTVSKGVITQMGNIELVR